MCLFLSHFVCFLFSVKVSQSVSAYLHSVSLVCRPPATTHTCATSAINPTRSPSAHQHPKSALIFSPCWIVSPCCGVVLFHSDIYPSLIYFFGLLTSWLAEIPVFFICTWFEFFLKQVSSSPEWVPPAPQDSMVRSHPHLLFSSEMLLS